MKKTLFIFLLIFLFPFFIFSMGNGGMINFHENIFYGNHDEKTLGASYTIKPDNKYNAKFFLELFTGWNIDKNYFSINGVLDYRLFEAEILPNFNLYGNAGIKTGFDFYEFGKFSAAPRLILGFSFIFFDGYLEFFIQQAVEQNVRLNFGRNLSLDYPLSLPIGLGFRIWD